VCLVTRRPPAPPLFPYTTLFRSHDRVGTGVQDVLGDIAEGGLRPENLEKALACARIRLADLGGHARAAGGLGQHLHAEQQALLRSEEHTSELQSRENLVCRLLLE